MAPNNHFATLGLSIGADESQIKKAYRTLAKKWHPDKNHEAGAKEKFQEIAASYEYLSSKDRREMLERELRKPAAPAPSRAEQSTSTAQQSTPQTSSTNFSSSKKTKKPNEASWSETFTKNYRSQQAKAKSQGTGGSTFSFTSSDGPTSFSFKFSHCTTEKPTAFSEDDIFDELFRDYFDIGFGASSRLFGDLAVGPKKAPKLKKPKPRNVAPERGTPTDLDEEYLFTPRYKDNDGDGEKLSCPWCNQLFTRGRLAQHEEKCGKFGLSGDEDDDEDYESDEDMSFFTTLSRPEYAYRPVWQQKQEELREKIRRDKMRYREQTASNEARDLSLIKCPYCDRNFNSTTAGKHIPWCKEYVSKYGIPMNFRSSKLRGYHETNDENLDYTANLKTDEVSGAGRERAREYAKNIKKPSTSRKETSEEEKTGNDKKFPYTRPRMPSAFGVAGSKFASDPAAGDLGDMGNTPSPSSGPDKTRAKPSTRRSSMPGNSSDSKTRSGVGKKSTHSSNYKQKYS